MASSQRRHTGYQAQFRRKGFQPISKLLSTLEAAEVWLRTIESEIDQGIYEFNRQADTPFALVG